LASDVEKAKLEDEKEYKKALKNYEQRYAYWNKLQKLANKIIGGDPKGLIEACKGINTFKQIIRLIPLIEFKTDDSCKAKSQPLQFFWVFQEPFYPKIFFINAISSSGSSGFSI